MSEYSKKEDHGENLENTRGSEFRKVDLELSTKEKLAIWKDAELMFYKDSLQAFK